MMRRVVLAVGLGIVLLGCAVFAEQVAPSGVVGQLSVGRVAAMAYSASGEYLAIATGSVVKLGRGDTHELVQILAGHTDPILCLAFSPRGLTLASGSDDNTIKLWNAETGELLRTLTGHTHDVNCVA